MFVIEALSKLPPRQRACVVLRYYEDLSVEDVAEVLGCRAGTVKSQTARGLTSLRALFEGQNEELIVDTEASTQPSTEARTW
jgi:RNA polymerase sigma factor (sigma-70 family)